MSWSLFYSNNPSGPRAPNAVRADLTGFNFLDDFTVEFWLRNNGGAGKGGNHFIAEDHSTGTKWRVRADNGSGSRVSLEVTESSGGLVHERDWSGLDTGTAGLWTHLAITFNASAGSDATQMELFQNGISQGGGSLTDGGLISGTFAADGSLFLGGLTEPAGDDEASNFNMFDVRVWNDIRTSSEIAANYLKKVSSMEPGLVANWLTGGATERLFPAVVGAEVVDLTVNGNNLTLPDTPGSAGDTVGEDEGSPPGWHDPTVSSDGVSAVAASSGGSSLFMVESDGISAVRSTAPGSSSFVVESDGIEHVTLGAVTAAGGDTDAPVILNLTPPPGTRLPSRDAAIRFDVTDVEPGIARVNIICKLEGLRQTLTVFRGNLFLFVFPFTSSSVIPIDDGYRFTVRYADPGWPSNIEELFIEVIDRDGNIV